jgi:ribose/xylose/arabinose/galactoside ABC-type transport system permease subunit
VDRTRFLARLIGLYCLLAALVMAVERGAWVAAITALLHEPPLLLLLGMLVVAAGLALVLAHNVWSGGVLPVLITVIGWLTLLKGLMFWTLPPDVAALLYLERLHYGQLYYFYCGLAFAIGLSLTVAGFRGRARAP